MKFKALLCSLLAATAFNASASTYTSEFSDNGNEVLEVRTFNDGQGDEYTETWAWLDLSETSGVVHNDVVSGTGVGGAYEGWTAVTHGDVVQMFNDFFTTSSSFVATASPDQGASISLDSTERVNWRNWFGEQYGAASTTPTSGSTGLVRTTRVRGNNKGYVNWSDYDVTRDTLGTYLNQMVSTTKPDDNASDSTDVSDSTDASGSTDVSEPMSLALFGLSLLGLATRRARSAK